MTSPYYKIFEIRYALVTRDEWLVDGINHNLENDSWLNF